MPAPRMHCPTCGAEQEWSATCRRCQCDLRLLRDLVRSCDRLRRRALEHLHAGRNEAALEVSRRLSALVDDAPTRRLLAVCRLLCSLHAEAVRAARQTLEQADSAPPPRRLP